MSDNITPDKNDKIKFRRVLQGQVQRAEQVATVYRVSPEDGVSVEDLLRPETWAHVYKQFRRGDLIQIEAADASWFAEFYVLGTVAEGHGLRLVLRDKLELNRSVDVESDELQPKYANKADKWCVVRKSDGARVAKGLPDQDAALAWIKNPTAKAA